MKILILQDDFPPKSYGGAGVVAFNLAKGFKDKGNDVYVISTVKDKAEEGKDKYGGFEVYNIYSNYHERWRAYLSLYNPMTVIKVKNLINEIKPDVVFASNIHFHISYYSLKLAKKGEAKVFLIAHDVMLFHYGKLTEFINPCDLSIPDKFKYKINFLEQVKKFKKRYNPLRNLFINHYLKYVDKIFAVSFALQEALEGNGIKNIKTVHAGINFSLWEIDEGKINDFKKEYGVLDKKIVLFGGRLSGAKGGREILKAMIKIIEKVPSAVLLVVGEGKGYEKDMVNTAEKFGLKDRIIFTGWILGDKLKAAYHSSDVVVVSSVCFDSFPVINLEAMACAKPVVGTCFGGTPEIVEDNVTGFIVNPFNTEVMAEKISYLLLNPEKAREFGKRGYNKIKEKFSIDKWIDKYLKNI
ncbi:MAG: glycosyltransferase family 4 protein [Parcubacteria group bacterium]|nr:glycosyltransferase family 4 protein [Parcubacteria group bacterium]MCR4342533.1 glycosyltransferase family 4 protein [Patescibacteria group bacterium]